MTSPKWFDQGSEDLMELVDRPKVDVAGEPQHRATLPHPQFVDVYLQMCDLLPSTAVLLTVGRPSEVHTSV
jgi:hypothetical protein